MRKSIRATVWIVVCCVVIVSSLGIGVAQSAGDNATNGTQPAVDTADQNNTTRVKDALRGSGPVQQNRAAKQPGDGSGSDKRSGIPEGGKDKGGGKGKGGGKDKGFIEKTFFGLINDAVGALVDIVTGTVEMFTELVYDAATYTPYPKNIDNWFQNPHNSVWPTQWDMYKTITRPLTFFLLIIATGLFLGFRSNNLGVMDPATEKTMKRRLAVGWVMFPVGWSLGSLYLATVAFITKILGRGMTAPNIGGDIGKAIGLLIIIAVLVFEFWTVLLMLMLIGLRIAGLVAFLPFLPLFFALRAIPIVSISESADAIIHLWVYLALLPLPMGALIAIGFSDGLANMIMNLDVGGVILVAAMKMGALVGAIIVPFAMYQKMKDHGFATGFGSSGGGVPGDKLKESYKRQRETAERRHQQYQTGQHAYGNFNRGRRAQPELRQDGQERLKPQGKAHRVGRHFNPDNYFNSGEGDG